MILSSASNSLYNAVKALEPHPTRLDWPQTASIMQ